MLKQRQERFAHIAAKTLIASVCLTVLFANPVSSFESKKSYGWGAFGEAHEGHSYAPPRRSPSYTFGPRAFPTLMDGGSRPIIKPLVPPQIAIHNSEEPGTVLIDTEGRKLYLTLSTETALVYPISVGREGFTWTGTEKISRIAVWPDWYPPKEMRERDPRLPKKMLGGPRNPLGAVALFLGNSLYRIHGTNDPKTIGRAASSGCFRMLNGHALHLASMVDVGTTVKVLPRLAAAVVQTAPSVQRQALGTPIDTISSWITKNIGQKKPSANPGYQLASSSPLPIDQERLIPVPRPAGPSSKLPVSDFEPAPETAIPNDLPGEQTVDGAFFSLTGWASAPQYDAEHPGELNYRPFPIGPLLSETLDIDHPRLARLLHPDLAGARALIGAQSFDLPLRFKPGVQVAEMLWADLFSSGGLNGKRTASDVPSHIADTFELRYLTNNRIAP